MLHQLGIGDLLDDGRALDILITSLAAIVRQTRSQDLEEAIERSSLSTLKSLHNLRADEMTRLGKLVTEKADSVTSAKLRSIQEEVQRYLRPVSRKKLAAYYTKPIGLRLMAKSVQEYADSHRQPLILSDPFIGSGLTLCETLGLIKTETVSKVWGVEPHPLPAMVAYAALLEAMHGATDKVEVAVGDVFKTIYKQMLSLASNDTKPGKVMKPHVIVTNPPFTRWEILGKQYRRFLSELVDLAGYGTYVRRKQLNLQLVSLFLMDYLLEPDGLLVSVLPASTFYTIYGEGAKRLLREKYSIYALAELDAEPSFSTDSGFKEVVIIAGKENERHETAFVTLRKDDDSQLEEITKIQSGYRPQDRDTNWIDISRIPQLWENNWLTLFAENPLRELLSEIFQKAMEKRILETWMNVYGHKNIVRGVEMYGPEFFLIPNKYWKIDREDRRSIHISRDGQQLEIGRRYLTLALRKPGLYTNRIVPQVKHYFLSVPAQPLASLPKDLTKYIEWGNRSQTARPAMKAFGEHWYSHAYRQIRTKKPYGRIFLPDKVDPSFGRRGVFACYTDEPLTASKNFYVATFGNKIRDKAVAAWFNSTLFLALFVVAGRKISERWTRFLEEDYLRMPMIDIEKLSEDDLSKLATCLDAIKERRLHPINLQLGKEYRVSLDTAVFETLRIERAKASLEKLYSLFSEYFTRPERTAANNNTSILT